MSESRMLNKVTLIRTVPCKLMSDIGDYNGHLLRVEESFDKDGISTGFSLDDKLIVPLSFYEAQIKIGEDVLIQFFNNLDGSSTRILLEKESTDMIVYKGIVFYKSSGTSGSDDSKRKGTWIPSLGLNPESKGIGTSSFQITKLDIKSDKDFSNIDDKLSNYRSFLGDDLCDRLNIFDIMIMSAELGGGFWETNDGIKVLNQLNAHGNDVKVGGVKICDTHVLQFEVPYEVKAEDDIVIKRQSKIFNQFFEREGGIVFDRLCQDRNYKTEVLNKVSNQKTLNRNYKTEVLNKVSNQKTLNRNYKIEVLNKVSNQKTLWQRFKQSSRLKRMGIILGGAVAVTALVLSGFGIAILAGSAAAASTLAAIGGVFGASSLSTASAAAAGAGVVAAGGVLVGLSVGGIVSIPSNKNTPDQNGNLIKEKSTGDSGQQIPGSSSTTNANLQFESQQNNTPSPGNDQIKPSDNSNNSLFSAQNDNKNKELKKEKNDFKNSLNSNR
ncbi:hypothetical protein N9L02_03060 [Gammaproteobacteria bacterium]|nr:hypothetical protein [Gammaproteobacteria bacterium]